MRLGSMLPTPSSDSFTPQEIARAAGVPETQVLAALGLDRRFGASPGDSRALYIGHADAVRIGRMAVERAARASNAVAARASKPLFSLFADEAPSRRARGVPLALSSTLHAGLMAIVVFIATFNLTPRAATVTVADKPDQALRLVFLSLPGPGGGGGGGGLQQPAPPPKAQTEGRHAISSPLPVRRAPKVILPIPARPEPRPLPVLKAEPLPAVVAPIVVAPVDTRTRIGVLLDTPVATDSHGPGTGGGVGTGTGTGLGEGTGTGVGPGSGGGTGGGPYRPGSGIEAPRLLREVKADYTEDARQRGVAGDVVLEIVVRSDGAVSDVRILHGLASGLNERAVQAVRQWRFAPARRLGAPVDVIVEVSVEFTLR